MVQSQSMQRRSWAIVSGLGAVLLGILVTLVTGHIAVLLGALVIAGITTALWAQPYAASRTPTARPVVTAALEPVRPRTVTAANGADVVAIALDVPRDEGYTTMLTSAGYALVNREGQIVYTFKQ